MPFDSQKELAKVMKILRKKHDDFFKLASICEQRNIIFEGGCAHKDNEKTFCHHECCPLGG